MKNKKINLKQNQFREKYKIKGINKKIEKIRKIKYS